MSASPAVGRALDILLLLAGKPGPVSAAALARELDLPRSSVYHILAVLQDRGFGVHRWRDPLSADLVLTTEV
ncbi:helix-turn-helix domain-containing protein, partial [Tsukamurella tyrosinosolvens]|uniref:helix-turn-helix domain-containing protein n=1 Tax=Tsukamurella tyrosinosolvens TaxID=57704 RepID=UPI002480D8E8